MSLLTKRQLYILDELLFFIHDKNVCALICEFVNKRYYRTDEEFGEEIFPHQDFNRLLTIPGLDFDYGFFGESIRERLEYLFYDMNFDDYDNNELEYFFADLPLRLLLDDFELELEIERKYIYEFEPFVMMFETWWRYGHAWTLFESNFKDAKNYNIIYKQFFI